MNGVLSVELYCQALFGLIKLKKEGKVPPNRNKKTNVQNYVLRGIFDKIKYPSTETKKDIAIILNLSLKSINVWFQNERQTLKADRDKTNRSKRSDVDINIIFNLYLAAVDLYNV